MLNQRIDNRYNEQDKLGVLTYCAFAVVAYSIAGAVYVCDSISHLKERFSKGKSVGKLLTENIVK